MVCFQFILIFMQSKVLLDRCGPEFNSCNSFIFDHTVPNLIEICSVVMEMKWAYGRLERQDRPAVD